MATTIPTVNLKGGAKLPIVGFGTGPSNADPEKLVESALENGYRHIDTAYLYRTEKAIGNVLKKWFDAGKLKREDLFITTKLPPYGNHPDRVEFFLKKSLEDLQLDYVDLYLIHYPIGVKYEENAEKKSFLNFEFEPITDHIAIWQKLEEQVDAGRTKAIGVSNFNIPQVQRILDNSRIKPACNQVRLHVQHQQRKLVEFLDKNGIVTVAYSPLGRPKDSEPGKGTWVTPNLLELPLIKELAEKYSKSPGQILLRHTIQRNIVVVPTSTSPQRQKENLDLFDFTLSTEDVKKLDALDKQGTPDEKIWLSTERFLTHPEFPSGI